MSDVYCGDRRWIVRYLVVSTSRWLGGRTVLVSPQSVNGRDPARQILQTGLSREQVARCPDLDPAGPVSQQHEPKLSHYYGCPSFAVTAGASVALAARVIASKAVASAGEHLWSVRTIAGSVVHALDGDVGHVEDVLVDDNSWTCRHLLVSVCNGWAIRSVLVPCERVRRVSWSARAVEASLPAEAIRLAPLYDRATGVSPGQEARLGRYYGLQPGGDKGARSRSSEAGSHERRTTTSGALS